MHQADANHFGAMMIQAATLMSIRPTTPVSIRPKTRSGTVACTDPFMGKSSTPRKHARPETGETRLAFGDAIPITARTANRNDFSVPPRTQMVTQ